MTRKFVIKNLRTKKYWSGDSDHCNTKDITKAEMFTQAEINEFKQDGLTLKKSEHFVEVEMREKPIKV